MAILKRKKKLEIEIQKSNQKIPDTKNEQQTVIDVLNDPEFKMAMIKASSDSDIEATDPTKFTLLENLHDREKADYYTEYKDKNEVEQVNRIQTWARLMPIVFGDTPQVLAIQKIVLEHVKDNMVNRSSMKRKRESALVYAVKQDTGMLQTDKQVASFLGGGKK